MQGGAGVPLGEMPVSGGGGEGFGFFGGHFWSLQPH